MSYARLQPFEIVAAIEPVLRRLRPSPVPPARTQVASLGVAMTIPFLDLRSVYEASREASTPRCCASRRAARTCSATSSRRSRRSSRVLRRPALRRGRQRPRRAAPRPAGARRRRGRRSHRSLEHLHRDLAGGVAVRRARRAGRAGRGDVQHRPGPDRGGDHEAHQGDRARASLRAARRHGPDPALAARHGLHVLDDCAQAHAARYKGRPVGVARRPVGVELLSRARTSARSATPAQSPATTPKLVETSASSATTARGASTTTR